MANTKKAKVLSDPQYKAMLGFLGSTRNPTRDRLIFLLSTKAGLRAKEIAFLKWCMVLNPEGVVGATIDLTDAASKGRSGRVIPICRELGAAFQVHLKMEESRSCFDARGDFVVRTQRSHRTSPQAVVNMFRGWYQQLGYIGCSSHSGRRTFITRSARKIALVGGSLRDVQYLAGHLHLQTTQAYIEFNSRAHQRVVEMI